ncbi:MAG: mRNA interferase toxin MazF [Candidatus Tokpelaia sp. JSC188]|nr:MAG: mRNA interferase toxin MazF [Candidatus Tokpelaia sp. JSC188]
MALKRGNVVTIAVQGDYGKPRPAIVVQANQFLSLKSVMVLPLTSDERANASLFRVVVYPTKENGLRVVSQAMIDKAMPIPIDKVGAAFGSISRQVMREIDRRIVTFFGVGSVS